MEFSFVNNEGKIQSLKLKMGDNWAEKAAGNEELNSIFTLVDDKDGIVEESEFNLLKKLLEKADTLVEKSSNDKQITKEELQELSKQVKNGSIDIEKVKHEILNDKFDSDYYSLEAIKERYPSDKFEVKYYDKSICGYSSCLGTIDLIGREYASGIMVFDKQRNLALQVIYDSLATCIIENNDKDVSLNRHFDKEGNLIGYAYNGETICPAMDRVYKSLTAKKWGGLVWTTGEDFLQNLKQTPPEFIEGALTYYEKTYGQSLMDAINEEWGLDSKIKKEALEYIINCRLESFDYETENKKSLFSEIMEARALSMDDRMKYARQFFSKLKELQESRGIYMDDLLASFEKELQKQKKSWSPAEGINLDRLVKQLLQRSKERPDTATQNIVPNGKIDADFKQGTTGDCWLLASIKAIANTTKGLEILNDSIKVNKDGSVTVTLKGKNKTYTFSKDEITRSSHLSTGDLDVRAIEMAVNKYITEEGGLYFHDEAVDINNNYMMAAFETLTGKSMPGFLPFFSKGDIKSHPERYSMAKITDEQIDNFNKTNHIACVAAHHKPNLEVMTISDKKEVLLTNHAYTVVRSDSKYVYLINPHDTSLEISVDRETFKEFFNKIHEMDL